MNPSEEEDLTSMHTWEDENGSTSKNDQLSDTAMLYLAQLKELQKQYEQERIQIQRLEMSIRGFNAALKEELEKGQ
jgi:hypothetical protein|tara:strand:+ start:519 stop:746 length:228 start_codon:yes stop_codon:yes gene_type:complete